MSNENELFEDIEDDDIEMSLDDISDELEINIPEIEDDICDDKVLKNESKHKEAGKHALKYDSIFKGKKEDADIDEYIIETAQKNDSYEPDTSSSYSFERESPTEYIRLNKLRKDMYDIIVNDIKLNIKNSRRKPSRLDFNKYYSTLVSKLDMGTYSFSEVFIELAYYFSDNIENMFKLLEKKWGGKIAQELAKKGNYKGAKNLDEIDFI